MGANRDWARAGGKSAIIQKLVLFFNIPKGEVINEPDLGCSLLSRIFDKLTQSSLYELAMELEYDLKRQIPELGVQIVRAEPNGAGTVRLTIYSAAGNWVLDANRDELIDVNLLEEFGVA